jgi:uncharacterized protein (TIGR02246 family)
LTILSNWSEERMDRTGWMVAIAGVIATGFCVGIGGVMADEVSVRTAVEKASADYVAAYNARDYEGLADQWADRAELLEGRSRVTGRKAIVASIRGWLEKHPHATLGVSVTGVQPLTETLARVEGVLLFAPEAGVEPIPSRFESLRVLDHGVWRLISSSVMPSPAAALEDLAWLVGTWRTADGSIQMVCERAAGNQALLCRTTSSPPEGAGLHSISLIYGDRGDGLMRTTVIDSSGAHAEGVIESDGISFHRLLTGVPAASTGGSRARWVQVIVPGGDGRLTMQSIERSIDGEPIPDGMPLHFRRVEPKP